MPNKIWASFIIHPPRCLSESHEISQDEYPQQNSPCVICMRVLSEHMPVALLSYGNGNCYTCRLWTLIIAPQDCGRTYTGGSHH